MKTNLIKFEGTNKYLFGLIKVEQSNSIDYFLFYGKIQDISLNIEQEDTSCIEYIQFKPIVRQNADMVISFLNNPAFKLTSVESEKEYDHIISVVKMLDD